MITNGRIHDARVPKMNMSPKLDQESCELLKGAILLCGYQILTQ
ncbi:type IV secretion system, VirB6 family domain protein [Anaplasma phagocytophilum str. CRT53-1]|uniref:Type IV secretion system, VirB6 family domain protein n=1 Tax=Anaplasma phagocytophilum str. CRT53-1 TaxID=1359157 RepID=A0A0F3Q5C8_ANAPH|nr:type IV secretion system, VirB6 family domain protein [Anaplasma phagocytophilum str. CRT53-1]